MANALRVALMLIFLTSLLALAVYVIVVAIKIIVAVVSFLPFWGLIPLILFIVSAITLHHISENE